MDLATTKAVSVIIAAYNAEDTLARAIGSALSQPQTAEVIVVDDASSDTTARVATAEADKDPRVAVIQLDSNHGPGAARNRALEVATAPLIAVLDADDVFLNGRFALLTSAEDCEMVADNIAFVNPETLQDATSHDWSHYSPDFQTLGTEDFVLGNLKRRGVARGELGFLKPVMSSRFLNDHDLRYDPELRLGEDYDLYVRMLLAGARMKITRRPGYGAVVREGSLSAQHSTSDLARLCTAIEAHLLTENLSSEIADAMQAHLDEVRLRRDHRRFLDLRRSKGSRAAMQYLFDQRNRFWPVMIQILRDKLGITQTAGEAVSDDGIRTLLPVDHPISSAVHHDR